MLKGSPAQYFEPRCRSMAGKGFGGWQQQQQQWPPQAQQQVRPPQAQQAAAGWATQQNWAQQAAAPRPQMAAQQQAQLLAAQQAAAQRAALQGQQPAVMQGAAAGGPETYIVMTKGNDTEEVVVRTLTGEYVEKGSNHGRKVYQKVSDKVGTDFVEVYMYYWDSRDGPSFEGWWFGNKLGGTQVWSHCRDSGLKPPNAGWKIPWDGSVRPTLVVANKTEMERNEAQEKLKVLSAEVQQAVSGAQAALEQARTAAADYSSVDGLVGAEQALAPQMPVLMAVQKKLTDAQKGSQGDAARLFAQLAMQLRTVQNSVNADLTKIRGSRTKAQNEEKNRALEEKDMAIYQEIMPEATSKANSAEDMVEKTSITAEMIQAGGDDLGEVKRAVDETEASAKQAQAAIGEARIFINAKLAAVRRFEGDKVKAQASAELGKLQVQLQAAQTKLNPLKAVRQEFLQRTAAQKMVQEVLEKLSPAEVDVDRAEEATVMLSGDNLTKEHMQAAEATVKKASDHLDSAMKFLEGKKKVAQGLSKDELVKLEERARAANDRLQKLKNSHKEANERVAAEMLLKEAVEKLTTVQEAVARAADAEGPFLMGVEELPLEETLSAVKACETAVTSANTAVSIARMFIATKLVEVKRFSSGPAAEGQQKLRESQKQLEGYITRIGELKKATAQRKGVSLMREAEAQVVGAEALAKNVAKAAEPFIDDAKLMELKSDEIREAGEATAKAESAANAALAEARKFITARQIEAKGKDASTEISAELIKLQTRLSAAQAEVSRNKKLSASVEQRLAAKRVIEEANTKMTAAEEKVQKCDQLIAELGETTEVGKTSDVTKKIESATSEAQTSLKMVARYVEVQSRTPGNKEELSKLQPRIKAANERLDGVTASMREASEKLMVAGILAEAEQKVKDAEEAVKKTSDAEAPFLHGAELPADQAASAFAELEKTAQAAHTTVGGTKTFLAMKRLAAKRLAENASKSTTEGLTALQVRLDEATQKLTESRKGMAERKQATIKRESVSKVEGCEQSVKAAQEATSALDGEQNMAPDKMKAACEKAGTCQQEAQALIAEARSLILNRQKEAKTSMAETKLVTELKELVDKLTPLQVDLDKQKGLLRDQEHKFVAQRLMKEATEKIADLEAKLESTNNTAAPLISEEKKVDWTASVFLTHIIDTLKQHLTKTSTTSEQLFATMCGKDTALSEATFLKFLKELPQVKSAEEAFFSEEQMKGAFQRMDSKGVGSVAKEELVEQFRSRYICTAVVSMTDSLVVKGGKTVRKLEIGEVVECLGEPSKDDVTGLLRMKGKTEKDDKEGYITLSGNQGTVYFETYSSYAAFTKSVEAGLKELAEMVSATGKYIEQKTEELKSVRSGPLAETKAELMKLRPQVKKVQMSYQEMKKSVLDARKAVDQCMEIEKQRRQEVADKKAAETIKEEIAALVSPLEAEVEKLLPAAKALVDTNGADQENPLKAMAQSEKELEKTLEAAVKATEKIKTDLDKIKNCSSKGPFAEARSSLIKIKVKVGAIEQKCKKQIASLRAAHKGVAVEAQKAVILALQAHAQAKQITADVLFKQLCKSGQTIPIKSLREFVEKIPDSGLKASQIELGLDRYESGLTKLSLCGMLQGFQKCVKEIALTTTLEVKDSKTLRKLEVGELVQILETAKEGMGLERARCLALSDAKEGWVTLKGNQGTTFLEKIAKPYYCCEEEVVVAKDFESTSAEISKLQVGAVLEVLEGPRKEQPLETQRVKGKAPKDGKTGWVTMKDAAGTCFLEPTKVLVCKASIAITTAFDIADGKAIRKLEAGETLEILEEEKEDESRGLLRIKARTHRDNKDGYVTLKGNQGTAYVEESSKHYKCTAAVALEDRFASGSKAVRSLEVGETFEIIEGPKLETKIGASRLRGRNIGDGKEGWVTLLKRSMVSWSPHHSVKSSIALHDGVEVETSKVVRKLEVGESVEALESPQPEKGGVLRVRLRAEKDGATGFATVKGNQGSVYLESIHEA